MNEKIKPLLIDAIIVFAILAMIGFNAWNFARADEFVWTDVTIMGEPPHADGGGNAEHCGLIHPDNIDMWYENLSRKTLYAFIRYKIIKGRFQK